MTIPSSAIILDDLWTLSWRPTGEVYNASVSSWSFQWTALTDSGAGATPGARAEATTFVNGSTLFLYGGFGTGAIATPSAAKLGFLNDLWSLDLSTATWTLQSGSSTPIYSQTSWTKPKKTAVTESLASLPALAGASAFVQNRNTPKAYVVIANGYSFATTYNYTIFLNLTTFNTTFVAPRSAPAGRAGALMYPSLYTNYALQYGGYTASGAPLTDVTWVETSSGTWSYICDTTFCAKFPTVSWCEICLYVAPTENYSGLKNAYFAYVNSSSIGESAISLGGQTRAVTSWVTANWTTVRSPDLPHVTLPTNYCSQPNPSPSSPYVFQCVGNAWEAANVCTKCSLALNITSGSPVQISGDFAPEELQMTTQDCTFLNISGTLSVSNVTGAVVLSEARYLELAMAANTCVPFVQSAGIKDSTFNSTPTVYLQAKNRTVIIDACTTRTLASSAWILNQTTGGRTTLDVSLSWTERVSESSECQKAPTGSHTNVVLLVLLVLAAAVLVLLVLIAIIWKHNSIKNFFFKSSREKEASEKAEQSTVKNEEAINSYEMDASHPHSTDLSAPRSTTKLVTSTSAIPPRVAIAPIPVATIYSISSSSPRGHSQDTPREASHGEGGVVLDMTPVRTPGKNPLPPHLSPPSVQQPSDSLNMVAHQAEPLKLPQRPYPKSGIASAGSTPRRPYPHGSAQTPLRNAKSMTPRAQPSSSPIISRGGPSNEMSHPHVPAGVPLTDSDAQSTTKKAAAGSGPIAPLKASDENSTRPRSASVHTPKSYPAGAKSDVDYESGLGSLESSMQNDDDPFIPDMSHV